MAQVNVINVIANQAKAPFLSKISFEIFFEALQPLSKGKFIAILWEDIFQMILVDILQHSIRNMLKVISKREKALFIDFCLIDLFN
jgi:hypothetical protein